MNPNDDLLLCDLVRGLLRWAVLCPAVVVICALLTWRLLCGPVGVGLGCLFAGSVVACAWAIHRVRRAP